MTEEEWLNATDPLPMLFLCERGSQRKLHLVGCACCRCVANRLASPARSIRYIETVERFADGGATPDEVAVREWEAWEDQFLKWRNSADTIWTSIEAVKALWPTLRVHDVITRGCEVAWDEAVLEAMELSSQKRSYRWWKRGPKLSREEMREAGAVRFSEEGRVYCRLFRDVFGNPFRPVTVHPSWLTSTVATLAQTMYESRDFSPMPILADALQDAGCEIDDILNHCRGDGVHVRGCWVVDLVLGKE
jgi:hypothetical protein